MSLPPSAVLQAFCLLTVSGAQWPFSCFFSNSPIFESFLEDSVSEEVPTATSMHNVRCQAKSFCYQFSLRVAV